MTPHGRHISIDGAGYPVNQLPYEGLHASQMARAYEQEIAAILDTITRSGVGRATYHRVRELRIQPGGPGFYRPGAPPNAETARVTQTQLWLNILPQWHKRARANTRPGDWGYPIDTVIFHELVHAMRMHRGVSRNRPLPGSSWSRWGASNSEEYMAFMVERMYETEHARPSRVQYLWHRGRVRQALITNGSRLTTPERWAVEQFYLDQGDYARALRRLSPAHARYNPFRIFERWRTTPDAERERHQNPRLDRVLRTMA